MGTYKPDYQSRPDTAVPICWLFEHRLPQVPRTFSAVWHEAVRRAIESPRDDRGWAHTEEMRDFVDGVDGLDPELHILSLIRFSRPDGESISEAGAHAARQDVHTIYTRERNAYGNQPARVPDGIAQLVVPPLVIPLEHGQLWHPEASDLHVFDFRL